MTPLGPPRPTGRARSLAASWRALTAPHQERRPLRGLVRAAAGSCLLLIAAVVTLPSSAVSATSTTASGSGFLIAADYFGEANPINFWNSDLSSARADFQRIKSQNFNTVGLVLPWGEFQPGVEPERYNAVAFSRLSRLVALAQSENLGVILRLGYSFDAYPNAQMAGTQRSIALFGDPKVHQAWLDYVGKVRQTVAKYSNVRGAYISWEDYWTPIQVTEHAATPQRQKALAKATGFRAWLQKNYSLDQVGQSFGTTFTNWNQVPAPTIQSPAYELMFRYQDDALVHDLFVPAAQRFPGLTMESRVDNDDVFNGSQVVSSYSHSSTWQLPGTSITGMYFSPYMNDPSTAHTETAQQGIRALQSTLSTVKSQSGGRALRIYEYEFVSNAPAIASDPALAEDQVVPFIRQSLPILQHNTKGYALFTYRDFNLSPVYNPSFSVGTEGWQIQGSARAVVPTSGSAYLAMSSNSSAAQAIPPGLLARPEPLTVSLQAAPTGRSADLSVSVDGSAPQQVHLTSGSHGYQVHFPSAPVGDSRVVVQASSPAHVTNIQVYGFTQLGDNYSINGSPGIAAAAVSALNKSLASAS